MLSAECKDLTGNHWSLSFWCALCTAPGSQTITDATAEPYTADMAVQRSRTQCRTGADAVRETRSGYLIFLEPSRWPSGKASASREEGPGFESRGIFSESSHTSDLKIRTPVATLAPGVIGSVLGLVGPASVYCD